MKCRYVGCELEAAHFYLWDDDFFPDLAYAMARCKIHEIISMGSLTKKLSKEEYEMALILKDPELE
jgi:hypothetical protein